MKFYLYICPHEGVFLDNALDGSLNSKSDFEGFMCNLLQVNTVHFQKELISYEVGAEPDETYPAIRFNKGESMNFALIFKKEGMGEYNRYKREIKTFGIGMEGV